MGLLNWIFDIYQHQRIDEARQDAAQARAQLAAIRQSPERLDLANLEHALGELALALKTTRRIMIEKGLCTEQEFAQRLIQVDLEDGRADGRAPIS